MRPTRGVVKSWIDEGGPKIEKFVDELQFKRPSQQK